MAQQEIATFGIFLAKWHYLRDFQVKGEKIMQKKHFLYTLVLIVLSAVLIAGCSSSVNAPVVSFSSEDLQAKNLTPPAGKALVYFYYGRLYQHGNIEISVDNAVTPVNGSVYALWEVPAGTHQISAFVPGASPEGNSPSLRIECEAGRKYYYRLISHAKSESEGGDRTKLYKLASSGESNGQKYVNAYSLVSWFRDGQLVYQNIQALPTLR